MPIISAGGEGGFTPVTCYLTATGVAVQTQAQHPILWNALFDNPWDQNALVAIPSGLGLAFAFDGSSADITTTTAGTWAFTHNAHVGTDTTFAGWFNDEMATQAPFSKVASGGLFRAALATVYTLPSAAIIEPLVDTQTAGTSAVQAGVEATIVRLA